MKPASEPKSSRSPRSRGVTIFGLLLIISSLVHIHKLIVDIDWYTSTYNYWPADLIVLRYAFSWFQRLLGILAGVGILMQKNPARLLAMGIAWFTMLTLYWKHPYPAFLLNAQNLDKQYGHIIAAAGVPGVSFASLAFVSLIVQFIGDIAFCSTLIYFFTRPPVKKQFPS